MVHNAIARSYGDFRRINLPISMVLEEDNVRRGFPLALAGLIFISFKLTPGQQPSASKQSPWLLR
jgi:hypothetical protein